MPVTCWGSLAELVTSRCKKGSAVIVEGRIESRKFKGDDGESKKYVNIVARDVRFVDSGTQDWEKTADKGRDNTSSPSQDEIKKAKLISQLFGGSL